MSEQQNNQQTNDQQNPPNSTPQLTSETSQQQTQNSPQQQTQTPAQPQDQTQNRSSSDIEAENRALRAILGAHVEGMNIDEELEFVGPTGKYRPQAQPQQEAQPETRTSRRQSVSNSRAEQPNRVDIAAIDNEFDDFMKSAYGFNFSESQDA